MFVMSKKMRRKSTQSLSRKKGLFELIFVNKSRIGSNHFVKVAGDLVKQNYILQLACSWRLKIFYFSGLLANGYSSDCRQKKSGTINDLHGAFPSEVHQCNSDFGRAVQSQGYFRNFFEGTTLPLRYRMLRLLGNELSKIRMAGVVIPSLPLLLNSIRRTALSPGITGCSGN